VISIIAVSGEESGRPVPGLASADTFDFAGAFLGQKSPLDQSLSYLEYRFPGLI
jgi:hypothetical protein